MPLVNIKILLGVIGEHTRVMRSAMSSQTGTVDYRVLKKSAAQTRDERPKRSTLTSPRRPGALPWLLLLVAVLSVIGARAIGRRNVAVGVENRSEQRSVPPPAAPLRVLVKLPNGAALIAAPDSPTLGLARYLADPNDHTLPRAFAWSDPSLPLSAAKSTPDATATLESIATILTAYPAARVRIDSHTGAAGDAATNRRESIERSFALKRMLMARGIDGSRVEPVGSGADKPLAPNDSANNHALSGRVEIVVTRK